MRNIHDAYLAVIRAYLQSIEREKEGKSVTSKKDLYEVETKKKNGLTLNAIEFPVGRDGPNLSFYAAVILCGQKVAVLPEQVRFREDALRSVKSSRICHILSGRRFRFLKKE